MYIGPANLQKDCQFSNYYPCSNIRSINAENASMVTSTKWKMYISGKRTWYKSQTNGITGHEEMKTWCRSFHFGKKSLPRSWNKWSRISSLVTSMHLYLTAAYNQYLQIRPIIRGIKSTALVVETYLHLQIVRALGSILHQAMLVPTRGGHQVNRSS